MCNYMQFLYCLSDNLLHCCGVFHVSLVGFFMYVKWDFIMNFIIWQLLIVFVYTPYVFEFSFMTKKKKTMYVYWRGFCEQLKLPWAARNCNLKVLKVLNRKMRSLNIFKIKIFSLGQPKLEIKMFLERLQFSVQAA